MIQRDTITIKIELDSGSDFQRNFAHDTLSMSLQSWMMYLLGSHKKNDVQIRTEGLRREIPEPGNRTST